jgi:hypothetical protein
MAGLDLAPAVDLAVVDTAATGEDEKESRHW